MNSANISVIRGNVPILISAPHAYPHKRPNLTSSYKAAECWTDYLCEQICMQTGAWGIFTKDIVNFDPNFHKLEDNPYKQELANVLNSNKMMYFIDLHGLSDLHEYDLGSYYAPRFSNSRKLAEDISNNLNKEALRGINIQLLNFVDNDQETLGEFVVRNFKAPSVQLEIARYIREEPNLRDQLIKNMILQIQSLPVG